MPVEVPDLVKLIDDFGASYDRSHPNLSTSQLTVQSTAMSSTSLYQAWQGGRVTVFAVERLRIVKEFKNFGETLVRLTPTVLFMLPYPFAAFCPQ